MGGFMENVAKRAGAGRKAADALGLGPTPEQRQRTPPVTGPGAPTAERPVKAPPGAPAGPPAGEAPLGPVPTELSAALDRMLGSARRGMMSAEAARFGRGDDRNQFFSLFGRTPTPREVSAFKLKQDLERRLNRPPTVVEVKSALLNADFVDRRPEPFG